MNQFQDEPNPYEAPELKGTDSNGITPDSRGQFVKFFVVFLIIAIVVTATTSLWALFKEVRWGQIQFIYLKVPLINLFLLALGVFHSAVSTKKYPAYPWKMSLLVSVALPVLSTITTFVIVVFTP